MATEAPDPRGFKSWEDAFQYPIPVVRKLETQLRSNAGDNREKLRSLVGASYRSLLDTAETIIDMEVRMEQVEAKLAKMGQNCNSRGLDRITDNTTRMDTHNRSRDLERYTLASQLAVLRNCPIAMARLMRTGGSYLLIAKVLVVSRLIHKGLSQSKSKPPIVDQIWDKLVVMRSKLLRRINKHLATTSADSPTLVETMCAYSLATSSTPTDVLRHFHTVRKDEVAKTVQRNDDLAKHGIEALRLCIQTCQDTQAIFPRRLADSLAKLKAQPLALDQDVRALYELNLDIHDRWMGEEARNYTPQPRHDELQRPEAERLLHKFSKEAIFEFLAGIKAALKKTDQLQEVASLRQELIETWLVSGSRMAGVKSANVLDDLRDAMNHQLEFIVRSRSRDLKVVVAELNSSLSQSGSGDENSSNVLWKAAPTSASLSNGAQSFKATVSNTHQGRDDDVIRVASRYDAWMDSVLEVKGIIKSMKETRWDDTFTDDIDDSDDDFGDSKHTLLSDDDPHLLEEVTQEALGDALNNLGQSFEQIIAKSSEAQNDASVTQAVFILRVVREISDRMPRLRLQDRSTPPRTPFTADLVKPLQTVLAQQILQSSTKTYAESCVQYLQVKSQSNILWEGNPPIPAQPSPSAFRFLQSLTKSMASYGSDLWAPESVYVLKDMAQNRVESVWRANLETLKDMRDVAEASSETDTNGDGNGDAEVKEETEGDSQDTAEVKRQKLKQLLFDILYVQRYTGASSPDLVDAVGAASEVDEAMLSRVKEKAADYGRKTYLLFALLC
ncbi:hypothetical protein EJ04DRAFT_465806 [Polyplosphaeria fusca]|uniref:Conserved oligomeric Golgi complex subunit 1 n=1 Tax=Polyplosphaeria fusca TaxID=682080 RepID=A0A9P4R128_9PLEO|nr:hypothetical protein EJ04DRAFT_465806 [Polyplosphaeria fusca]